jgi:hypothetical protein
MTSEVTAGQEPAGGSVAGATDEQLIAMLVGRARGDGLKLTGEGGLLQQLTKRVLESALDGEITDHVGYDKHDRAGRGSGNTRNGSRTKTVLTDVGPVEVRVPRDAAGPFEPQIVRKRQRRLSGSTIWCCRCRPKGLTHGEISAHLAEVYGTKVRSAREAGATMTALLSGRHDSRAAKLTQDRNDMAHHKGVRLNDDLSEQYFLSESAYWLYVLRLLRMAQAPEAVFEQIAEHRKSAYLKWQLGKILH